MSKPLKKLRRRVARFLLRDSDIAKRLDQAERRIRQNGRSLTGLRLLLSMAPADPSPLIAEMARSKSQFWQDLFVLAQLDRKRNGYFVDFGATDGVHLSNTYLLEREYGWTGIVAEPARCWHGPLQANRTCHVETDCVWKQSGQSLAFNETSAAVFSTLSDFSATDLHAARRKNGTVYDVKTISLLDLLQKYNAPRMMDYLSIDTEGSEYEILSHFDFDRYSFRVITCEHNYTSMREKLSELLSSKGYERKFEQFSACDDWYVKV